MIIRLIIAFVLCLSSGAWAQSIGDVSGASVTATGSTTPQTLADRFARASNAVTVNGKALLPNINGIPFQGLYVTTDLRYVGSNKTAQIAALAVPGVFGAELSDLWNDIETSRGVYDWSRLDFWVNQAVAAGNARNYVMPISLDMIAGVYSPSYIYSAPDSVPQVLLTHNQSGTCHDYILPQPWNSAYIARYNAFMAAMATHMRSTFTINGDPEYNYVVAVRLSGFNFQTSELNLPGTITSAMNASTNDQTCTPGAGSALPTVAWIASGYTPNLIVSAWNSIQGNTAMLFPDKIMSLEIINYPYAFPLLDNSSTPIAYNAGTTQDPMTWQLLGIAETPGAAPVSFSNRLMVQWNALSENSVMTTQPFLGSGAPLAWQTAVNGQCNVFGSPRACTQGEYVTAWVTYGIGLGGNWIETRPVAVSDPNAVLAETQLAAYYQKSSTLPDIQKFTANGTWTKPNYCLFFPCTTRVRLIASGPGGGQGAQVANGTVGTGGATGGGAECKDVTFNTSSLPVTVALTIPSTGGAGGSTSVSGAGQDGLAGADATFGSILTAHTGGTPTGGQVAAASAGGASGGIDADGGNAVDPSTAGVGSQQEGSVVGGAGALGTASPYGTGNTSGGGASTTAALQGLAAPCVGGSGTGGTVVAGSAKDGGKGGVAPGTGAAPTGGTGVASGTPHNGTSATSNGALFPASSGNAGAGGNFGGVGGVGGGPGTGYGCAGGGGGAGSTAGGAGGPGCPGYAVLVTTLGASQ